MSQTALGRQFQQLDMLRPARDLVDPRKTIPTTFRNAVRDPERLKGQWDRTLQEAKPIQASIREHGIQSPVELRDSHLPGVDSIVDGHHRTSVAHDIGPDYLVPVKHFSTRNHVR